MTTTVIDDRACAAALIVAGCRLVKAHYSPDRSTKDLFEFERSDSMLRAYEAWRRYELAGSMRRYANVLRDLTRQRIVGDAIHG